MAASPKLSVGASPLDDDDAADEVKVFRTTEADDGNYNGDEPLDELAADKTDVAFEADIESEPLGERSAFSAQQQSSGLGAALDAATAQQRAAAALFSNLAFPSPGYEYILPFLKMPLAALSPQSPLSPFHPANSPLMRMSPSLAQAAHVASVAQYMRNSPSFQQFYGSTAFNLAASAHLAGAAAFGGGAPLLQPVSGALNNLNAHFGGASTSSSTAAGMMAARLPPSTPSSAAARMGGAMNSPVSSMATGLNGMSLLERSQQAHRGAYKSVHTTPKRTPHNFHQAGGGGGGGGGGGAGSGQSATDASPVHQQQKTPKREKMTREEKMNHIKKPCNAFMWYMRVNRKRLLAEEGGQQIQSAIINKRLGMEWQGLSKEEQQKYFKMAAEEREEHQKNHPDWTARDNYAVKKKNKKKSREKSSENNDQKKCRARYGVENQAMWCKHCKRKKRCLNVREAESPSHVSSTTHPQSAAMHAAASSAAAGSGGALKLGAPHRPAGQQQSTSQVHASLVAGGGGDGGGGGAHISSSSSNASSTISRHVDSPSSSGVMSVGKRTESNASSNFDPNTPPPGSNSTSSSASQPPQHHHSQSQYQQQIAQFVANFATPKADALNSPFLNAFGSPNATPLAAANANAATTKAEIREDHDVEMAEIPKPMPSHLPPHLNPAALMAAQQHQHHYLQQQQQQHQQQQQQLFNFSFNHNQQQQFANSFMAANPLMAAAQAAAAAAFSPNFFKQ